VTTHGPIANKAQLERFSAVIGIGITDRAEVDDQVGPMGSGLAILRGPRYSEVTPEMVIAREKFWSGAGDHALRYD